MIKLTHVGRGRKLKHTENFEQQFGPLIRPGNGFFAYLELGTHDNTLYRCHQQEQTKSCKRRWSKLCFLVSERMSEHNGRYLNQEDSKANRDLECELENFKGHRQPPYLDRRSPCWVLSSCMSIKEYKGV